MRDEDIPHEEDVRRVISDEVEKTLSVVARTGSYSDLTNKPNLDLSMVNVKNYGAIGDGVIDDRFAIIAAQNSSTTGRKIYFPAGSYLLSSRLNAFKQGMVLEGESPYTTKLLLNSAAFEATVSDVLIRNMTIKGNGSTTRLLFQILSSGTQKNWRFENCRFDGVGLLVAKVGAVDNAGVATTTGTGHSDHFEIVGCEFLNYTADGAFIARGMSNVIVDRCHFHDLGASTSLGDNCKMSYGSERWKIVDSIFERSTRDAIDCYDARRGLIQGNTMIDIGVHAVEIKVVSATAPNPVDKIQVIGNYARRCHIGSASDSSSAAFQMAGSNLIISGNVAEECSGVGFRSGKTTDGLTNHKDVSYVNNQAIGNVGHGFVAVGVDRLTYLGNHSVGSTGGRGFDVGNLNTSVIGAAALNQSSGNAFADVWS